MSIIAAGTTAGTALKSTGNTDGTIQLQVNGTTPSVTLATTGAIGVGSTPGYGTSGQVLVSGGSAAAPSWATPATGALTFISSQTVSTAVASVDFTTGFSSTYDDYLMLIENVSMSASDNIYVRLYRAGALVTSVSYSFGVVVAFGTTPYGSPGTGNAEFNPWPTAQATNAALSGTLNLYQANTSGLSGFSINWGTSSVTTNSCMGLAGACRNTGTGSVTGIRFYPSASNITAGTFRLYGIAKA